MNSRWEKKLPDEKERGAVFSASYPFRKALLELINEDREGAIKNLLLSSNYTIDAWSEKVADQIGFVRALDKLIRLLEVE